MSPNKEGAALHHEVEMGKWNTLKHGCWDVLLCCCGNTYGMRGFGVVRVGGGGGVESSFSSLKEICACAPSSCVCVRLCEALQHIQSVFLSFFPLEFKGSRSLK